MMLADSVSHRSFGILCAVALMAAVQVQAADPDPPGSTQTGTTDSNRVETNAGTPTPENPGSGVAERLRHKDRAVTAGVNESASALKPPPGRSSAVQHNQTDMELVREGAASKSPPHHSPEWTDSNEADPGRSGAAEKGGTADINIGVGENQAAGDRTEDDR